MSNYDFKEGKHRIIEILNSKTKIEQKDSIPSDENEFTYENGINSWVGAIFVDIVNSMKYFKENNAEHTARVMRAFCNECITILMSNDKYRQIGVRGDCVYAIYSTPLQKDLERIFSDACEINTFIKMFNKILTMNRFATFNIGIGLGCSESLIIKAGKSGTGINDNIWIGDSVIDASKLSSEAGRNGKRPICIDSVFYNNIKDFDANDEYKYSEYAKRDLSSKIGSYVYYFDLVATAFNYWIDGGMK